MTDQRQEALRALLDSFEGDFSRLREALNSYERDLQNTSPMHTGQKPAQLEEVIAVKNVSKHYKLGRQMVHALNNVTLSIGKGEFVAITGASGSGKSTLLQIIGCLDKPSAGVVAIEGKETAHLGDNALSELRQKSIGFIFQSFYLQPFLRLSDNLAVPAMFTAEKKAAINSKVARLLDRVGLSDRAKHFPKELSGGQIQRAAIARALINNPRIILADEPTGNLDSTNSKTVIELFRAIRDSLGTTIVVVTHDETIARQADRVISLKDGAII